MMMAWIGLIIVVLVIVVGVLIFWACGEILK